MIKADGNVTAAMPGETEQTAREGMILCQGASVRTGGNSRARLLFSNGCLVAVEPECHLVIGEYIFRPSGDVSRHGEKGVSSSLLKVKSGEIVGIVPHLDPLSKCVIETPVGRACIRGTAFLIRVGREPAFNLYRVTFGVASGSVEVEIAGMEKPHHLGDNDALTVIGAADEQTREIRIEASKIGRLTTEDARTIENIPQPPEPPPLAPQPVPEVIPTPVEPVNISPS